MSRSRKTADEPAFKMQGRNWALPILFGFVALGVVVGLMAQSANPDDHSGRSFGTGFMITVAIGIAVLLIWQNGWYRRSREHYVDERVKAATGPAQQAHPDLDPLAMRRAMAVDPSLIDPEETRRQAEAEMQPGTYSMRTGQVMCGLIGVFMLPALLLQNVKLIVFGAIPIVLYAVYLCIKLLMKGGGLDQAYSNVDAAFAPLGLRMTSRPQVAFSPALDLNSNAGMRMTHHMEGPMTFEGTRHGRGVHVEIENGTSVVHVAIAAPAFKARSRYGHLTSDDGGENVAEALAALPSSSRWTGVKVASGADGITVRRKTDSNEAWVYDLWLAEALAGMIK